MITSNSNTYKYRSNTGMINLYNENKKEEDIIDTYDIKNPTPEKIVVRKVKRRNCNVSSKWYNNIKK